MIDKEQLFKLNPREYIVINRDIGKSDQVIFDELTTRFSDKNAIANLIAGTPTTRNKNKYKIHNATLFVLLLISIIFKIFNGFESVSSHESQFYFLMILLSSAISLVFAWGVYNYIALVYKAGGILTTLGLIKTIISDAGYNYSFGFIVFDIIFAGAIAGLFFFLANKLFSKSALSQN